ncbi:MAG TPA: aspartyl/asparaginyl beta-hydroxylase domain-containing protein [Caulobacteraceae bacterium]
MAVADPINAVAALKERADQALRRADLAAARTLFEQAALLAPGRVDLWLGLAASRRALGDHAGALEAVEGALTAEPRSFPGLLMKGSLLEALDQTTQAAILYGIVVRLAPPAGQLPEPTRAALAHARSLHERYADDLAASLMAAAGLGAETGALARRAETFIGAITGRRQIFQQEPAQFHYPGMPAIEFYEREEFPWLETLEAETDAIREEAQAVWGEGGPGLEPYIEYPPGAPVDQWAELNHSQRWTAFHLLRDGKPVEANCMRCPRTMAALTAVDQPQIQGRSPAAMYSILRPRTRIPPHTGVSNTRVVLHLPLIIPEGCGFRVGGETRQWREGEAWVFDDTVNHEAWNDSDRPRAIFMCDVWSPRLSGEEREMIGRLTVALDRFNGFAPEGEADL